MRIQEKMKQGEDLVAAALKAGADAADLHLFHAHSTQTSVRLGKTEKLLTSEENNFNLRVFWHKRIASISVNLIEDAHALAERALAMAKVSPKNRYESLADKNDLAKNPKDLDLCDDYTPDKDKLIADSLRMEEAALSVKGVTNSGGASSAFIEQYMGLITSHGFNNFYKKTYYSRSISVVAQQDEAMERDYAFTSALHYSDLKENKILGLEAGERAVKRLGTRQAATGKIDVVFSPRVARTIVQHLANALKGSAVSRKTSLLKDKMGTQIMRPDITVFDRPLLKRGKGSRPFDDEGVAGQDLAMIQQGRLCHWFLSSSVGKELGLSTNGHAVRSSLTMVPSHTNFILEPSQFSPQDLISSLKEGFYVTELFGHGVDYVTGQYSRGASGFWVENGEITYPISGVTLASDLLHMWAHLMPANDLDLNENIASPSVLIEGMTLAGI